MRPLNYIPDNKSIINLASSQHGIVAFSLQNETPLKFELKISNNKVYLKSVWSSDYDKSTKKTTRVQKSFGFIFNLSNSMLFNGVTNKPKTLKNSNLISDDAENYLQETIKEILEHIDFTVEPKKQFKRVFFAKKKENKYIPVEYAKADYFCVDFGNKILATEKK